MSARKCAACGAENVEEGNFCIHCGEPLGGEKHREDEPPDRFKTLVAVLIAVVSIAGAVLAWRVSVASSGAADADVGGVVSVISRNEARIASEAEMYRNLWAYLQVRLHDLLSDSLVATRELYPSTDPNRDRLWDEAWTEILVAEEYLDQVNIGPEYIRADGSYDGQAAQDIDMAHRALAADFDPQGRRFGEADTLRSRVQRLMGLALVLSAALLFYTMAEVIVHRLLRYLCFALGTAVFVLVLVGLPLVELGLV